jgi:uncharacterized protein (TIGR04255 family)
MVSSMKMREIYPNAPVVLVATEVRHDHSDLLSGEEIAAVRTLLREEFPLVQPLVNRQFTQGPDGGTKFEEHQIPRFASRDERTAVTYNSEAVIIETTNHVDFDVLRNLVELCVSVKQEVQPVEGLLRVGLRYIDEVRVPDLVNGASSWQDWVSPSLLGPTLVVTERGLQLEQSDGVALFRRTRSAQLVLRYGARVGFAIPPGGPLKRDYPPPGPFFLFDIDSFWQPEAEAPRFEVPAVAELLDELHEPISMLFESLITEKLRSEVLRND